MGERGVRSWLQRLLGRTATRSHTAKALLPTPGRIISETFFEVSAELAQKLHAARSTARAPDEVERDLEAFLLDPGLGPARYLTRDGRVVWEDDWGPVEPSAHNAYAAVVVGAKKTGVHELLALLPPRTGDAVDCARCHGTGRFDHNGQLCDVEGQPFAFVCPTCGGLGWRRGVVPIPTDLAAWLEERIAAYESEAPQTLRWLSPYVSKHQALPLLVDWTDTAGIRADGGVVWWSTEESYAGTRPVHDARELNVVLAEGAKHYPTLGCLVPVRPSDGVPCPHCRGQAMGPEFLENVICYCGGLGWIPREQD